jgi:hypothetical protein
MLLLVVVVLRLVVIIIPVREEELKVMPQTQTLHRMVEVQLIGLVAV